MCSVVPMIQNKWLCKDIKFFLSIPEVLRIFVKYFLKNYDSGYTFAIYLVKMCMFIFTRFAICGR